jgi:arginase
MQNRFILSPFFLDEPVPELERLADADWAVNRPQVSGKTCQDRMAAIYHPLAEAVTTALSQQRRPVVVAGDCCNALGVCAGIEKAGLAPSLLWLDAHGDFNTWETTPSGFLGGMPLAMLVGRGERTILKSLGMSPMAEQNVILSDARDLDPPEREALEASEVHVCRNPQWLPELTSGLQELHVHIDTDIISLEDAPAMNYPAGGGPRAEVLRPIFHKLARAGNIRVISMSAWNPALDRDGRTRELCMSLLEALAGE